jgi:hypothetical protein
LSFSVWVLGPFRAGQHAEERRFTLELMPDRPAPQPEGRWWKAVFAPRRVLLNTLTVLYCPVLFLALDFAYSTFTRGQEQARAARIFDPVYDHGLVPNSMAMTSGARAAPAAHEQRRFQGCFDAQRSAAIEHTPRSPDG